MSVIRILKMLKRLQFLFEISSVTDCIVHVVNYSTLRGNIEIASFYFCNKFVKSFSTKIIIDT